VVIAVLMASFVLTPQIDLLPTAWQLAPACCRRASALFGRSLKRTPLAGLGHGACPFGRGGRHHRNGVGQRFHAGKLAAAQAGETVEVGPWLVKFENVMPIAGPNWTALEGSCAPHGDRARSC
jgi:cytochrome c-type biogenesis protein CcmF